MSAFTDAAYSVRFRRWTGTYPAFGPLAGGTEPGVRIVYQQGSVVRSFAVDSLISWRGVWYVVHLGPNPRPSDAGTVDQPETGPGTPGPPGGG